MSIKDYKESEIRASIKKKVPGKIRKSRSASHNKLYILLDKEYVRRVTLPNEHPRIMRNSKSKYIADDLMLKPDEFMELIDCDLSGSQYLKKLKAQLDVQDRSER